jgi:PqqD family protein of HPr-rel-A system
MAGARYIADPESAVETVALDGLSVLFHAPSGTTHILAAPAPELLAVLREGPADLDEIFGRLSKAYALEPSPIKGEGGFAEALAARLDELEAAGLVRRA